MVFVRTRDYNVLQQRALGKNLGALLCKDSSLPILLILYRQSQQEADTGDNEDLAQEN